MLKIGTSPFAWLQFDEHGALIEPGASTALDAIVAADGVTDLVVIAHGWKNDLPDAFKLYTTLWGHAAEALTKAGRDPATFAVAGVLWPAKRYDADYDGADALVAGAQAGGARSLDEGDAPADLDDAQFAAGLGALDGLVSEADAEWIAATARRAAESGDESAAYDFFRAARGALGFHTGDDAPDRELAADGDTFRRADTIDGANDLLGAFSLPFVLDVQPDMGAALGLGDTLRGAFQGARNGVVWSLNMLTYYAMKKRAGMIGEAVANVALAHLHAARPIRLHLVGHSFGGRLVTAAANALRPIANIEFRSMTLLQAAYSHNGLVAGTGPFAAVVGKPSGPIAFTFTHNDRATTIIYPLASRVSGDTALSLGDANDAFGAMGANGPQKLDKALLATSTAPGFAMVPGKVNLVPADAFVVKTDAVDAHNNVANATCGAVVASAITT